MQYVFAKTAKMAKGQRDAKKQIARFIKQKQFLKEIYMEIKMEEANKMSDNNRSSRTAELVQIIGKVCEIVQKHPELRLCQIFSIAAKEAGWLNDDLFYLSDIELLKGLMKLSEK